MIFAKTPRNAKFYRSSILIWTLFIAYEVLFSYLFSGKSSPLLDYISAYVINITLFYVNAHIVLPYLYKKSILLTTSLILLELVAYTVVKYSVAGTFFHLGWSEVDPFSAPLMYLLQSVWRFIYFMGLSTGYWFALNIIVQRKEISDLEKSKLLDQLHSQQLEKKLINSEVAYLKSQINPHFLFNTLNFLYNTAQQSTPQLGEPILLLSDIMRYALTETPQTGKVELADEIDQISTFITLNQYRFDHNLQLSFDISGDPKNYKILPLILLTPVENIFKYADLRNAEHPAKIELEIIGNILQFKISNRKLKAKRAIVSHGVGLKNLKLRLDAYYPDSHHIQISENDDHYIFELQLTL